MSAETEKNKFHRPKKSVQRVLDITATEIEEEAKRARRETPGVAWHRKTMERYGKQVNGDPLDE